MSNRIYEDTIILANVGIGTITPIGKLNIFTGLSGVTMDLINQPAGSVSFANLGGATAIPTIVGKSLNNLGLFLMGANDDGNLSGDITFDIRKNDNTDFITNTNIGFKFSRFGVPLLNILRNGNTLVGANIGTGGSANLTVQTSPGQDSILLRKTTGASIAIEGATGTISPVKLFASNSTIPDFFLYTANAERMRITSNGNVGINTNNPLTKLEVYGDSQSTYIAQGYISSYVKNQTSRRIGVAQDYNRHVILLHPVYDTTNISRFECSGKIIKRRGGTNSGLSAGSYYINTATGYVGSTFNLTSEIELGKLYTCYYNSVKYVALIPSYSTSACEYSFDGYIYGDANELLLVPYFNSQTSAVLNAEINGSLVEVGYGASGRNGNLYLTNPNANILGGTVSDRLIVGNTSTTSYVTFNGDSHPSEPAKITLVSGVGNIGLNTNNIERITVLNNGNVGIGQTAPSSKLDVNGDISLPYGATLKARGYTYDKLLQTGYNGSSDVLSIFTAGAGVANATEKMTILATSGNVGIGTITPATKLHVVGNIRATGLALTASGGYTASIESVTGGGSGVFGSLVDRPQSGMLHAVELGTTNYCIYALYKASLAANISTTLIASVGLTVQATNAGGTIALQGFANTNNVRMRTTIEVFPG